MTFLLLATAVFISAAFFILTVTLVSNLLFFQRLEPTAAPEKRPFLSILIPARNEAAVIQTTLQHILDQTYAHFELILLDDQSTDGTGALAQATAAGDPRFRLINGRSLPPGWLGKNWACHQLAEQAQGELLLFLDADVRLDPIAVAALVTQQQQTAADLLTVWPTQHTQSWSERLIVPLMGFAILTYLPILPVHYTHWPAFAAANGQCLLFRRRAYEAIGGHETVRQNVVEDVALAQRIKRQKLRLRMSDGNGLVACRMYDSWPAVRDGFSKNILAGHQNSILFLLASTLFHWLLFVLPVVWLLIAPGWLPATWLGLGVGLRLATAVYTRQRPFDALLMPLSVILMTRIALNALWWRWRGTATWKGRTLKSA